MIRKLSDILNVPIWYIGCYDTLPEHTFGEKLHKARLYHGHTIDQLATVLGSHRSTVRQWECDKYKPNISLMDKIQEYICILSHEKKVSTYI
ncbi:helix-turn-helix domain-containing protein [Clostridium swellfunianum]|uniref:helix-turn-helix domain-containing protein n=1 Tax=Clostridium swellfunianum TaxID=1367462 RepID=UPI003D7C2A57|nr:helix-turn-helix domain-containing protein [Clostridium swellfunianum]